MSDLDGVYFREDEPDMHEDKEQEYIEREKWAKINQHFQWRKSSGGCKAVFEATKARAVDLCEKMARSGQKHGASMEFQSGAYACTDTLRDMQPDEPTDPRHNDPLPTDEDFNATPPF